MAEEPTQNPNSQPNANPFPDPALLDSIINDPMATSSHKALALSIKNDKQYQQGLAVQKGISEDIGITEERPTETLGNLGALATHGIGELLGPKAKLAMEATVPQNELGVALGALALKSPTLVNPEEAKLSANTISKTLQMGPKIPPTDAAQIGREFPEVMAAKSVPEATKDYVEGIGLKNTNESLQSRFGTEYVKPEHWQQAISEAEQGLMTGKVPHGSTALKMPEGEMAPFTAQEALDGYHSISDLLREPKYLQEASKGAVGKMKDYLIKLKGDLGNFLDQEAVNSGNPSFKELTRNLRLAHLKEDSLEMFPGNYNGNVNMLRSAIMMMSGLKIPGLLANEAFGLAAQEGAKMAMFSPYATTKALQGVNLGLKVGNQTPTLGYFTNQIANKDKERK